VTAPHATRTERLLAAPIVPTIARLALPGVVLVAFQTAVSVGDTIFIGRLGTPSLAGLALVFPLVMLLQMASAGAMGGGVSSSIARALGAGRADLARRLAVHAVVIAAAFGLAFTALMLAGGAAIYRLLGGRDAPLGEALAYSNLLFAGAASVWFANTFASILRGTGNMFAPAVVLSLAAVLHVPLSGALVLGAGPMPRLGIAGAAVAYVVNFTFAAAVMLAWCLRPGSALRPKRADLRFEWPLFADILRVGALSVVSSVQTVLTAVIVTGLVAGFGAGALAGYGVGVRLELLQIPLVFAIGQAMVALVGTNIGAGRPERAKRIAFVGAGMAAAVCLAIGLTVAIVPDAWVRLFSDDPAVRAAGASYLRIAGPFYPLFGIGMALYFASQGAGQVLWPVLAGTARLAVVVIGGIAAASLGAPLVALFALIALGMAVFGGLTSWFVARAHWGTTRLG
jgi:putative MATE family efflux protein